jgi:hypothetical protein
MTKKEKAQNAFNQNLSLAKISKKYNIPLSTLKRWSSEGKWKEERDQFNTELRPKTKQKTIEKLSEKKSDYNVELTEISKLFLEEIKEYILNKKSKKHIVKYKYYDEGKPSHEKLTTVELDTPDTKAFRNIFQCLNEIQKIELEREKLKKGDNDNENESPIKDLFESLKRGPK